MDPSPELFWTLTTSAVAFSANSFGLGWSLRGVVGGDRGCINLALMHGFLLLFLIVGYTLCFFFAP